MGWVDSIGQSKSIILLVVFMILISNSKQRFIAFSLYFKYLDSTGYPLRHLHLEIWRFCIIREQNRQVCTNSLADDEHNSMHDRVEARSIDRISGCCNMNNLPLSLSFSITCSIIQIARISLTAHMRIAAHLW